MTDYNVTELARPNLNLSVRQEGNFIIIGNGLPRSSGSVNESPFLEVTRNESVSLVNGAQSRFLEKLNSFGIEFRPVEASQSQTTNVGVSGRLPSRLASGEVAVEITSEVRGGVNFRSGQIGDAIRAAQENYDEQRNNTYTQRAREWATNGVGATAGNPHTGDTFRVSPEVAKKYHNDQYWPLDWRRVDSGQDSPSATLASANPNGFQGTALERHANQVNNTVSGMVPTEKREDVVAALLASSANFDRNANINVTQSTKNPDMLIASQGTGPSMLRADPVNISTVQPGSAQTVSAELLRNTNALPQMASQTLEQPQELSRGARSMA
jgi:hypothetical protein